jgi:hypothetical protein
MQTRIIWTGLALSGELGSEPNVVRRIIDGARYPQPSSAIVARSFIGSLR